MIFSLTIRAFTVIGLFALGIILVALGHVVLGIIEHLLFFAFFCWGTLHPNSRMFGPIQSETNSGIWLTLDDGPDEQDTPALLDLLDQYQAKATFFVIGEKAKRHPELIREIHQRGHQIGNHTWSHPQATFWAAGPVRTYREIKRCQNCLTEILGEAPRLFRAPVGHSNIFVHPILKALGLQLIGWNSRGFDTLLTSAESVSQQIRATLKEGSIVLAHESTPIAQEVVLDILKAGQDHGWEFITPQSPDTKA